MNRHKIQFVATMMFAVIIAAVVLFGNRVAIQAQSDATLEDEPVQHCAALLEPVAEGETNSRVTNLGCYGTLAEMEAAAMGHQPSSLTEGTEAPAEVTSLNTTIAQMFTGRDFSGTSFSWWVPNDPDGCRDGDSFSVADITAHIGSYWNNNVESARSYSGCNKFFLYRYNSYVGESITCNQGAEWCRNLGWMANHASSLRWDD